MADLTDDERAQLEKFDNLPRVILGTDDFSLVWKLHFDGHLKMTKRGGRSYFVRVQESEDE